MTDTYELPPHLQDDAPPLLQCTDCGRKSWSESERCMRCDMPQPDGSRCAGTMLAAAIRKGAPS